MPKKKHKADMPFDSFAARLARLRKARGLTQWELAEKVGLSQRMIAHYESKVKRLPATLLPPLARALKVSVEELLGLKVGEDFSPQKPRIWKKLRVVEKLPPKDQKTVLSLVDALSVKQNLD